MVKNGNANLFLNYMYVSTYIYLKKSNKQKQKNGRSLHDVIFPEEESQIRDVIRSPPPGSILFPFIRVLYTDITTIFFMLTLDKHYRTSIVAGVLSWHPNLYLVTDEGTSCIISGLDLKKERRCGIWKGSEEQ